MIKLNISKPVLKTQSISWLRCLLNFLNDYVFELLGNKVELDIFT